MASHGICFDFYYQPKPSQTGQNGPGAAANARLAPNSLANHNKVWYVVKYHYCAILWLAKLLGVRQRVNQIVETLDLGLIPF